MEELSNQELNEINGGGISFWGVLGIIAAGIFIVGVIDGIARPVKCG